ARPLDGLDIRRLFDHAQNALVATRIRAVRAGIRFREVSTPRAGPDAVGHGFDRPAGPADLFSRPFQQVVRQSLGRLAANAREAGQLPGQLLNDCQLRPLHSPRGQGKFGSWKGSGMPPVSLRSSSSYRLWARCWASDTAARIRSSSISTSLGSTTVGSILMDRILPRPSAVTVTMPPPLLHSTVLDPSSDCKALSRACTCWPNWRI